MLIFIHGFNSAGNSDKGRRLRAELTDMQVVTPTCPVEPDAAVAMVSTLIGQALQQGIQPTIVGSSLGGFYATWLAVRYNLPSILINPLVEQTLLRHEIGPQTNYYTGEQYEWSSKHCDQLDRMTVRPAELSHKTLLLLDEGDELLNSQLAAAHFANHAECHLYAGGSHRFEHMDEAMPLIRDYMAKHNPPAP